MLESLQSITLVPWSISLKFPPQICGWSTNHRIRFRIQLSNWSANCKSLEETLRWLVMCQVLMPWNVSRMNLPMGLVSINIKTVVKLWQRNFCMRVSICNWFSNISISRNWFFELIFCLFRTWFLNAKQAEKNQIWSRQKIQLKIRFKKSVVWNRDFKKIKYR